MIRYTDILTYSTSQDVSISVAILSVRRLLNFYFLKEPLLSIADRSSKIKEPLATKQFHYNILFKAMTRMITAKSKYHK